MIPSSTLTFLAFDRGLKIKLRVSSDGGDDTVLILLQMMAMLLMSTMFTLDDKHVRGRIDCWLVWKKQEYMLHVG